MRDTPYTWEGGFRQSAEIGASRTRDGVPFSAANGNGYEGYVYVDEVFSTLLWSHLYQAVCDDFT